MAAGSVSPLVSMPYARPLSRRPVVSWLIDSTRRGRLRRYARAMGWHLTTDGVLVGDVDGVAVRAYEDRKHVAVVELVAPASLPRLELRPKDAGAASVVDGLRVVHTGDPRFDDVYVLRAAEPWLARAIFDNPVRDAMVSAPLQSVTTVGERLIARGGKGLDPLDIFARGTALRLLMQSVPWEAYSDRRSIPTQQAVQEVVRARQMRPVEPLPSIGRRA